MFVNSSVDFVPHTLLPFNGGERSEGRAAGTAMDAILSGEGWKGAWPYIKYPAGKNPVEVP